MHGLDLSALEQATGLTLTLTLIMVLVLLALWAIVAQFTLITVLLRDGSRALNGQDLLLEVWRVTRKLFRPSSLPLVIYCFYVMPIGGYGFASLLTRGISIPPFISGELAKNPSAWALLMLSFLVLGIINLRLALTIPIFVNTNATGGQAMRQSFKLTRGWPSDIALLLTGAVIMIVAIVVATATVAVAVLPTYFTDKFAPGYSPIAAAIGLAIAQLVALLIAGLVTAALAATLLQYFELRAERLPATLQPVSPRRHRNQSRGSTGAIATALIAVLALTAFAAEFHRSFDWMVKQPDTLIIAHRGFSGGGVENTIGGLEAAASAGADLVEIDIMETLDNKFVVMHDANLKRLTGQDLNVADLTLAELRKLEVQDLAGHTDTIPSFAEYLKRANELGMRLLIEIKLGGNDNPLQVERIVAELEKYDALETHMYHSLDAPSVQTLKTLRPDLTVGLTMGVAGVAAPDTVADMIVVEQWSASEAVQRSAIEQGLAFFTWTVNDEPTLKEHLRRGVHGIITDHPDEARLLRDELAADPGLLQQLTDAVTGILSFERVLTTR